MNYQRNCRGNCYQQMPPLQRMAPRYPQSDCFQSPAKGTCGYREQSQGELKLPIATSLAMVYSPVQTWQYIYDAECALEHGTLFAELDKPLLSAGR
jgi:hypothetical protein